MKRTRTVGAPSTISSESAVSRFLYAVSFRIVKLIARVILGLGPDVITGREHVPATGGFIFASNHASYFDPPILAIASPRKLTYIAKLELFSNPLFAAYIRSLGAIPMRRGSSDRETLSLSIDLLRRGHGLALFPEGTRTLTGKLGRLKAGAAMLAVKAGAPIVPVWIDGSFQAWPKGGAIRRHQVRVRIGPPLMTAGLPDRAEVFRVLAEQLEVSLSKLSRTE